MGFFDIIEELDNLDKEIPVFAGVMSGAFWGIAKVSEWKVGNATEVHATDVLGVITTGMLIGVPVGTLGGYFWYVSVPALATYCIFGMSRAS